MSRLKIALIFLVFLFVEARTQKLGKHNFTSEWLVVTKDALFPPIVATARENLIYVTLTPDFAIRLESSKIENKPCEIPATSIRERRGKHLTPLYAEALGNGKVVVSILESKKETNRSKVWLYVIDPQKCVHEVGSLNLDAPAAAARDLMTIVPYQDSFDVFVTGTHCESGTICNLRYSDKPELISSSKMAIPYEDEGWDILTAKDYDPSEGYLYIVMVNKSNMTTIRRLDAHFSTVHKLELNISGSVAYWYAEDGSGSMCFGLWDQSIQCILLDHQLKIQVQTDIVYDKILHYYSIVRLQSGEAVILTILASDSEGSDAATYVQLLDLDGQVSDPIKFQEYICENVYEMSTFEVKDRLFCASTMCQSLVNTRCFGPADERTF